MGSHIGSPKAMPPVNLRRGWGEFHSVAKQASFNIAWRSDFGGFKKDFGRFWEAKTEAKIDFQVVVFRCFLIPSSSEQRYARSMSGCRPYFDD